MIVSSSVLEKVLKLSDRRIRQLADEGIVVRASKGKYLFFKSIQNYISMIKIKSEALAETDNQLDYDLEHAKHEKIKRLQNELKLKLMKGEVLQASQVERVLSDMLISFRNKLLSIPEKTSHQLENRNAANIKTTLKNEIHEILLDFKDYDPRDYYDSRYIDFSDGDETEEIEDYAEDESEDESE